MLASLLVIGCGKGKPMTLPQLVQEVRESIVRIQMVGTHRDEGKVLTAEITLQ